MLVAKDSDGRRCVARHSDKKDAPYFCPVCKEEVQLKKGAVRIHHFSHKPDSHCQYGTGESQQHLRTKEAIYETLIQHPACTKCELERILKGVRPDVSLYIAGKPVAIEVQKSTIAISEIVKRVIRYTAQNIYLIWIMPEIPKIRTDESGTQYIVSLKEWQKFLSACSFGRLYFWHDTARVSPIHFGQYSTYIPKGNWVEDVCRKPGMDTLENTYWYDSHYGNAGYGGYEKYSKTKKTVLRPPEEKRILHLAEDFRITEAKPYKTKKWTTPTRKLWVDNLPKWWK